MPDDERLGGTHSSAGDSNGYGRRHRRAEEPAEQPRRRRRSMEDGPGGLSVADLVQRHTGSRQDLSSINQEAHARRTTPPVTQSGPRGRTAEGRPAGGPQWPDQYPQAPAGRIVPPAPGQSTGRRALPDPPQDYGRRSLPEPPADLPPVRSTGRRAMPEDVHFADRPAPGTPDEGFGPTGYVAPPPAQGRPVPPAPGERSGSYAVPPPGPVPGRRALPDDGYEGYSTESFGRAGYGPTGPEGYGPAGPQHFGPTGPEDYGPAGDPGFGPAGHEDYGPAGYGPAGPDSYGPAGPDGYGPIGPDGYGPAGPDGYGPGGSDGYGPAGHDGYAPAGPEGFGPGRNGAAPGDAYGPAAAPDDGFGPPGRRARPDEGFGPDRAGFDEGFGPGHRADGGFGPGQGTGHRPMPDNGFAPDNGFGPHAGFGHPGQGSGPRPVPPVPGQGSGPRAVPPGPGQSSGPRGPQPGQGSGGRALPPGQGTGRRPMPEEGFGPGQGSGYRAVPPPGVPGGPVPGRPAGPPPGAPGHASGAIPRDPRQIHPPGAIPRDPAAHDLNGAVQPGDDRPAMPGTRSGPDEDPARPDDGAQGVPLPPPRAPGPDAISMTTEMEAIGEEVQKRRGIDHTLARFSAVHDEIQAEERERKAKRRKLMPWRRDDDDEMGQLDELVAGQTIAVPQRAPQAPPESPAEPGAVPGELAEMLPDDGGPTRLQEKRSRRRKLAVRVLAAAAAILVFVATGIAWGFKSWVDASSQQVDALDPNSDSIQDAAKQQGDENFLLVGSDTRAGAEAEDGVGDENEVIGARSDTVMIAHIPANRERAVVVSFPRDLEITRPECEGWDPKSGDYTGEQQPAAERVKLNTAYQVGGPKCVTKLVQKLTGLMINHFVGIDFNGFKGMVDAVQGVQLCVERPLNDEVLGTVVPVAGKNVTLSGDQALNFVRARHVQGDVTSDYGRIQRQQRFLSSLLRKAMSTDVLLDPGKLTNFVEAFSKSTFGDNIGVDQMIVLGQSLQDIDAGRVTFVTVPTVGEANERGNEDLRADDTKTLFSAIREDTPLPGEKGGTQQLTSGLQAQPSGPVDPKTIKLQVLNGGNPTGGIAGTTADQLAEFGYQIVWVDAAPEKVDRTVIRYGKGREAAARTLQTSVPDAELVEDPSVAGAVQLIIGPGFDGEVVAPGKGKPSTPLPADLSTINGGDVSCA